MRFSKFVIVLFCLMILLSSSVSVFAEIEESEKDYINPNHIPIDGEPVITIDGDDELEQTATDLGWDGTGTESDPIIADNLSIDGTGNSHCIKISNTDLYLNITDSNFMNTNTSGDGNGVWLYNCGNVSIINCTVMHARTGFMFQYSKEIFCSSCSVVENSGAGIHQYFVENSSIFSTLISGSHNGASVSMSKDVIFSGCIINKSSQSLSISNSDDVSFFHCDVESEMPFTPYMMENFTMIGCILNIGTLELRNVKHFHFKNNTLKSTTLDLHSFTECVVWNNSFTKDGIYYLGRTDDFDNVDISLNNTLNGLPILYIHNTNYLNTTIGDNYGQIIMGNVSYLILSGIDIDGSSFPLLLSYCRFVKIDNLNIQTATTGIRTQNCINLRITNSTFSKSSTHDIFMESTEDSLIKNNIFDRTPVAIFIRWNSRSVKIIENTISNSTSYGIVISDRVFNCLIHGNILKFNEIGIYFNDQNSHGNTISNNEIQENRRIGIYLGNVQEINLITDNKITGSGRVGIELYECRNVEFRNNVISDSGSYSILLNETGECIFYDNKMDDVGFMLYRYSSVGVGNTIPSNNTVNSMPVYYYIGNGETWSVPENTGQAVIDGCSNLKVEGISFDNISYPIVASRANNLVITGCSFNDCEGADIHIFQPSITTILGNNFTRSEIGIDLVNRQMSESKTVHIDFNNFTSINGVGLKVRGYKGFYTEGNRFKDCKFGCLLDNCNNYSMKKDLFIDCSAAGILMFRNSHNRITESTFYSCGVGIREIDRCNNNVLTFNLIKGCTGPAIHLDPTSYKDKIYNNAFILNNGTGETIVMANPRSSMRTKGEDGSIPMGSEITGMI